MTSSWIFENKVIMKGKDKMKTSAIVSALFIGAMVTGCTSYTGMTTDADDLVDDANQAYASDAQQKFIARMKAPARPVVIKEAPEMGLFLGPTVSFGHPLCQDIAVRKELVLAFKGQLREKVGGMKDFKLLDEQGPAMVAVGDAAMQQPANYRLTYNITSIELKENATGGLVTGIAGSAFGGGVGQKVADQKFWDGIAKVEVRLLKPDGTTPIFSFVGEGKFTKMVDAHSPLNKEILLGAVRAAADNAMAGYVQKFGPPIFVTDTCQGGLFARLSVGAKFGIQPNQKVEFYRNKVRKDAMGGEEVSRVVVASGIVGAKKAPVEDDGAWVLIDDFDSDMRKVFRFTSARIVK